MYDPREKPWSDNPNAPKIPYSLYFQEKVTFAGDFVGPILYGVVVVLFFHCMGALLSTVHRGGEGTRWGLVFYTVAMFSFVTVYTAMNSNFQSLLYINVRGFPGVKGVLVPGPIGYPMPAVVPDLMFLLNNWMADGLLLYRCYIIYSMNVWAIAFPCLMYLGSVAMGVTFLYQTSQPDSSIWNVVAIDFGLPYFSISIGLNIFLTLMIVVRLILHARNTRTALGIAGIGGLCAAIVTMLIESCALYAVSSLLFIGPWGAGNHAADTFLPILAETQVIAPLLVIQRVANESALANSTVVSRHLSSFKARNRGELTGSSHTLPDGDPVSPTDR